MGVGLWVFLAMGIRAGQPSPAPESKPAATIQPAGPAAATDNSSLAASQAPWQGVQVMGEPVWKYAAFALYIILAFYLARLCDYFVQARLERIARPAAGSRDCSWMELIHGPVKLVAFVILLHIGLDLFHWPAWLHNYLSKGMKLLVAISLTYVSLKFTDLLLGYWRNRVAPGADKSFHEHLFPLVRKTLRVFLIIVAVLVTSQNLGLNITGILASLSIGGLAVGLAAQDTLANLFGAVAVFLDKPFVVGDRIKMDSVEGTVEAIGMRSTKIRNSDGHLVAIPNKTMGNSTITNISRRPNIRTEINLALNGDLPLEKIQRAVAILEEILKKHPQTADLLTTFNRFTDSGPNIQVVHWWKTTDSKACLAGWQAFNLEIKRRFDQEGIRLAGAPAAAK